MPLTRTKSLCHLSSPAVTRRIVSNLPPDSDGPSFRSTHENLFPAHFSIGVHGLATRSPYGCRHCCRHRWALTPPFHPCLAGFTKETRGFGGCSLLRMHELTPVWQFHQCGALRCPDFPPLPVHRKRCRKQRQSPLACYSVLFFVLGPPPERAGPGDTVYRESCLYYLRFLTTGRLYSTPSRPKVRRRRPGLCLLDILLSRILI